MGFKNPYKEKLEIYSQFVFSEESAPIHKGKWSGFFSNSNPVNCRIGKVILEIGCLNAKYLNSVARAYPEIGFLGADWKYKMIFKGAESAQSLCLKNIAFLRVDASQLPAYFSKEESKEELDEIWIFFPDPWAKRSQVKNRLIQTRFLKECGQLLKRGGILRIKTDHPGYFLWMMRVLDQKLTPEDLGVSKLNAFGFDKGDESWNGRQTYRRGIADWDLLLQDKENVLGEYSSFQYSNDFWNDTSFSKDLPFSKFKTSFENSFLKQGLPVYYIELIK